MIQKALAAFLLALGFALCIVEGPVPVPTNRNGPTGDLFVDRLVSHMSDGQ